MAHAQALGQKAEGREVAERLREHRQQLCAKVDGLLEGAGASLGRNDFRPLAEQCACIQAATATLREPALQPESLARFQHAQAVLLQQAAAAFAHAVGQCSQALEACQYSEVTAQLLPTEAAVMQSASGASAKYRGPLVHSR